MRPLFAFVAVLAAVVAFAASAQRFPGRERNGSPREQPSRDTPRASAMPSDPFAALAREMPSLKVDLLLKAEQLAAWQPFERDIRELAEIDRQRQRYLMKLRDPADDPLPTAGELLGRLADEDRRRSDATSDLKRHFDALYGTLDEMQRRMIDRRLVLSQTQPLGQETPAKH
jgi:hypothetical protein